MTTESILIVDNEPAIRQLLDCILTADGCRCRQAADGVHALAALAEEDSAVALVDLDMPEMNGLDLLAHISERAFTVVPIVLTGNESVDAAVRSMKLGAFDFLAKPIDPNLLRAVTARALNYARARSQQRVLTQLAQQWQATFDACPDAMAVVDRQGRLVQCNAAMAHWVGRSKESLPGTAIAELPGGAGHEPDPDAAPGAARERETFDARWQRTFKIISAPIRCAGAAALGVVYIACDVTEPKQAEALLRARQDRLNRILDNLAEGILILDQTGRIVFANGTVERIRGQARAELIGQGPEFLRRLFTGPDGRPTFADAEPFADVLRSAAAVLGAEALMHLPDGATVVVALNAAPLPDSAGGVEGVLLSFTDITQRRQAELSMREADERYRWLFERGQTGVLRTAVDGTVLDCNDAFARTLGLASRAEVMRLSSRDFYFQPADREAFLAQLLRKGSLTNHELRFRRQDGTAAWVIVNFNLLRERDGAEVLHGTIADISERQRAETALRASERRFHALADSSADAILTLDAEGVVQYANPAAEQIFGYEPHELIGRPLTLLMPDHARFSHFDALRRYLATGQKRFAWRGFEVEGRHRQGRSLALEISIGEFVEDGLHYFTGHVRDISGRKAVETALRESEERLRLAGDAADVGTWDWDIVNNQVRASANVARIMGRPPDSPSATYEDFLASVFPDNRSRVARVVRRARDTGEPMSMEFRTQAAAGGLRWIVSRGQLVAGRSGKPERMLGVVIDITQRKQQEAQILRLNEELERRVNERTLELRETEVKYRSLVEHLPAITYRLALEATGGCLYVSPQAERIIGLPPSALAADAHLWLDYAHPEDRERVVDLWARCRAYGEPIQADYRIITPTGELVWLRDHAEPVRNEAGQILYYQGVVLDITDYNRERAGREQLQLLSRRLVEVQEAERRRIARELHDEIGQTLTGLKLILESAAQAPAAPAGRLGDAQALVNELLARVRALSLDLRPAMLDDLGLLPALLWFLERYSHQSGVLAQFEHTGLERRFSPAIETAAYRIVQEALTNVARHANVRQVLVRVWATAQALAVQITDHGVGFDAAAAMAAGRTSGLAGMRERCALLRGKLSLESTKDRGAQIMAEFPLDDPLGNADADQPPACR